MDIARLNFETILPLIGAMFSFSFGIFVWLKAPKANVNILFLAFCTAITYWLFGTFEMFLNRDNVPAAIYWDRFVYIGVVFVPSLMHHFSLAITNTKGQRRLLAMSYLFSFFFLFASRTRWFVDGLNVFPRLVHTRAAAGHDIFLVLFFLDASLLFVNLFRACKKADQRTRSVYHLTAAAFLNILIIGGTAYLPAYGIDIGYPFSYFSGVFFVILLSFAVTQYGFLESRVLVAEMFTFIASLIFTADIILSRSFGEVVFDIIALAIFLYFGSSTVRAMNEEIARRLEVQKLATQLAAANDRLKEADRLKSEFISIASHQLRTPITVIKGYLSLMLEGMYGPVSDTLHEKIDIMNTMNERLVQMINNMLNVSRIERNRIEFSCSKIDVVPLVRQVVEEMTNKAKQKGLALAVAIPENGAIEAFVDSQKIEEVLANLIDNAIKYTPKGSVTVDVRSLPKKKEVLVTVHDTGLGMNKEAAANAFQKFFRSKDPDVMREVGTGLGLYICSVFIRGMGGDIWVDKTAPGMGTTVAFRLPTAAGGRCLAKNRRSA